MLCYGWLHGTTCTTVLPVSPPGVKMAIKSKQAEHYFLYINVLGETLSLYDLKEVAIYSRRICWEKEATTLISLMNTNFYQQIFGPCHEY